MFKTRFWIILIAAAAVVLAFLSVRLLTDKPEGTVVEVIQYNAVLQEIDLSAVTEEYTFEVQWIDGGSNTVCVQPGRICISDADCPDKICVSQGWLSDDVFPIVCLPHRLIIQVKNAELYDAAAQ